MTPLQLRFAAERKARLARMGSPVQTRSVARLSKEPPPQVAEPKIENPERPLGVTTWFWLEEVAPNPDTLKAHHVLRAVCQFYQVTREDMVSTKRFGYLMRPRHVFCYLARNLTKVSLLGIGKVLQKDHTTIIHGYNKIARSRELYPEIETLTEILIQRDTDEDSPGEPDQDQQGGQVCNGLPRPQPGSQPDSAPVGGP